MSRTKLSRAAAGLWLAFAITAVWGWWLGRQNETLRAEIARVSESVADRVATRVPVMVQTDTPAPAAAPEPDRDEARVKLQRALTEWRSHVRALETRAAQQKAELLRQQARDLEMMETNLDAANGMVRLERLRDRGQESPAAALETLLWAAAKGDTATMKRLFVLSDVAAERARTIQQRLPSTGAGEWTVKDIGALFVLDLATQIAALEIGNERLVDTEHATIDLRMINGLRLPGIQAVRGEGGWKVVLPDYATAVLEQRLRRGTSM